MQRSKLLALSVLVTAVMITAGCPSPEKTEEKTKNESKPTDKFVGNWGSDSAPPYDDGFTLTADSQFICYNNGDPTNDIAYKGTVYSYDVSGDYLFLNIRVADPSRTPWGLTVGAYARIALQDVDSTQCKMSTGYVDSTNTAETIEALKRDFTFENGAFAYIGTYNKK